MNKKYFPAGSAMTKEEVLEMIQVRLNDYWADEHPEVNIPDIDKLTDERMQEFVNSWYDAMVDNIEFGDDAVGREMEDVLLKLAKDLQ